ncbi:MAG TPA: bifunctional riboflavin kinase/FAD synthetase [Dehalococcoidia bacterium]|nr:bifunctional riboflavin kinase/FAD synthetase [Dehalococcoidia bacterium]
MSLEEELSGLSPDRDMVLAVGVFDGVHLGHKSLLSRLLERARERDLLSGVVTFDPHPLKVLSPKTRLPFLADLEQRKALLKDEGVSVVIVLPFTRELARLSAAQFMGLLRNYLRLRELVIGPDFTLGRDREGNASTLRTLGEDMGFAVTVVPPVKVNGDVVSSTAIREALAGGDLKRVRSLVGRPFSLHGRVVRGASRGAKLDFPTANLEVDPGQALPAEGVYATWVYVAGRAYESMTNIGRRPTFGGRRSGVEVYILGYQGNLYGQELKIDIMERLRGERQFDTVEALKSQIVEDIEQGRAILSAGGRS